MRVENQRRLRGVVFRITIRGGHASVAIIVTSDGDRGAQQQLQTEERMVLVIVRLGGPEWSVKSGDKQDAHDALTQLRSNIRRMCKLGNEMEFRGHFDEPAQMEPSNEACAQPSTDWNTWDRFIVDYYLPTASSQMDQSNVSVRQELIWDAAECQKRRSKYFVSPPRKQKKKKAMSKNAEGSDENRSNHGGGIGKRKQGEIVADFLLWMLSTIYNNADDGGEVPERELGAQSAQPLPDNLLQLAGFEPQEKDDQYLFLDRWAPLHPSLASPDTQSIDARNALVARKISQSIDDSNENGSPVKPSLGGIIDAAGGAGHVSLALALRGVHSTVVDPRSTVGRLPGRDRKVLKKSKQEPFSTYRAWFGSRPKGVDSFFREGHASISSAKDGDIEDATHSHDPTTLPICSPCVQTTAIVALHPDEATGPIVEAAVHSKIPFVVVPCCVFSRLFPERIKPSPGGSASAGGNEDIVSTYYDLIGWLVAKHPAIRVTRLPFEGANIAVWATFQ